MKTRRTPVKELVRNKTTNYTQLLEYLLLGDWEKFSKQIGKSDILKSNIRVQNADIGNFFLVQAMLRNEFRTAKDVEKFWLYIYVNMYRELAAGSSSFMQVIASTNEFASKYSQQADGYKDLLKDVFENGTQIEEFQKWEEVFAYWDNIALRAVANIKQVNTPVILVV